MADTSTNLKERDVVLVGKDGDGNTTIDYPLTRAEMVEGLDDNINNKVSSLVPTLIPDIQPINKGGTGATDGLTACNNLGALPVSGGTITGNMYTAAGLFRHIANNGGIFIHSGSDDKSPYLQLYAKENATLQKIFYLGVDDTCGLYGRMNSLQWQGLEVARISYFGAHTFVLNNSLTLFYYAGSGSQLITLEKPLTWWYPVSSETGTGRYSISCDVTGGGTQLQVYAPRSDTLWHVIGIGN